mgnify:CR=1 FL=1
MFVVTGASGYVGGVLVRSLVAWGREVAAVIPPFEDGARLREMNIEVRTADVTDYDSVLKVIGEGDIVLHVAGVVELLPGRESLLDRVNVQGTKNIVDACLEKRAKRLVYVSSVHAFPENEGTVAEDTVIDPHLAYGSYGKSKARATLHVWHGVRRGLDAVIVHPSGVIGPFDYTGTNNITQVVARFLRGSQRARIEGGYDFVDVRDVATGIYLAAVNGRCGENYILSGSFITVHQLLKELGDATGARMPQFNCPKPLALFCAPFAELAGRLSRKFKPMLSRYALHTLWTKTRFSNYKARKELGWEPRVFNRSIRDMANWLCGKNVELS